MKPLRALQPLHVSPDVIKLDHLQPVHRWGKDKPTAEGCGIHLFPQNMWHLSNYALGWISVSHLTFRMDLTSPSCGLWIIGHHYCNPYHTWNHHKVLLWLSMFLHHTHILLCHIKFNITNNVDSPPIRRSHPTFLFVLWWIVCTMKFEQLNYWVLTETKTTICQVAEYLVSCCYTE